MKYKYSFLLIILFVLINSKMLCDSLYVYPSAYYTYGNYSTGSSSKTISGYSTFAYNDKTSYTVGYDRLSINYETGNYIQQNYVINLFKNIFPSYLKGSYIYINGSDTKFDTNQTAHDYSHLLSTEYLLYYDKFYLGIACTYFKQSGLKNLESWQITPRLEWIVSDGIYISMRPNFTRVSDNRNLFSVSGYVSWNIIDGLYLKTAGFLGERAFYFDTDLLTVYNQNDTQKKLYSLQFDYYGLKDFRFNAGYQHSDYSEYYIDYYYLGLRTAFIL